MKFGILLNHEYPTSADVSKKLKDLVTMTQAARDLGFDSLFGMQHYVSSLATLQPLPLLSHLASHAGGMEMGTGVYLATLEHPVQLAENFATFDHLCGGRLVLGLGAGYRRNEFDAFGVERSTRWSRLAETLVLLRALWSGEEV
ncbi:MAG TPA: LLM class flavin-dependent oxidoreductase, partial [Ilumatobacter sp.]|nr:LLM class flavin-dependent oxidoreductase [Ilumatobacter sp.]